MHSPSKSTIRSSCNDASCATIFSNPTSSTVFPLICIADSDTGIAASAEAYLPPRASRNETDSSTGLLGRTNEPAVDEGD